MMAKLLTESIVSHLMTGIILCRGHSAIIAQNPFCKDQLWRWIAFFANQAFGKLIVGDL
jgi:hypothetical protein